MCVGVAVSQHVTSMCLCVAICAGDGAGVLAQRQEGWQTDLRSDAHILAPHASLWHHQTQDLHPHSLGPCEWKKIGLET